MAYDLSVEELGRQDARLVEFREPSVPAAGISIVVTERQYRETAITINELKERIEELELRQPINADELHALLDGLKRGERNESMAEYYSKTVKLRINQGFCYPNGTDLIAFLDARCKGE